MENIEKKFKNKIKPVILNFKNIYRLIKIKKEAVVTYTIVLILISLTYYSLDSWVRSDLAQIEKYYERKNRFLDDSIITPPERICIWDSDIIIIEGTEYPHPDKLPDIEEIWLYGTNETNPDTDGDGMEDGWEVFNGFFGNDSGKPRVHPLVFDAFEDYDNDGWDANYDGVIDREEHLTNLEEYCGGSYGWGPFNGLGLNPQEHYERYQKYKKLGDIGKAEEEWREYREDTIFIQYHGGFHLVDYPYSEVILADFDEYPTIKTQSYRSYNPFYQKPLTPNPCRFDTDNDIMSDGYEVYFREKGEYLDRTYFFGNYNETLDPLDPTDAELDFDVWQNITGNNNFELRADGLINRYEFENGTDPTSFDTDNDSYLNPRTGEIFWFSDLQEVQHQYNAGVVDTNCLSSNIDWDCDGIINNNTDPTNPDTDSDRMLDGWELCFGLNPCNANDRYQDLDGDKLPNFLEFAYPNAHEVWFSTALDNPDTDSDGIPDGWEAYNAKVIYKELTTNYEDDLKDGLLNGWIYKFTSNPMIPDSELDLDGYWYTDPNERILGEIYHPNSDHMTNYNEYLLSIDPSSPDSDGDGLYDGDEVGYYININTGELVTSWLCDNKDCINHGKKILTRECPNCGIDSGHPVGCDLNEVEHLGGFTGELINGNWLTNPGVAEKYFTDPNNPNTDFDFQSTAQVNQSRLLDDWEEISGMQHEAADHMDNNGNGEFGSPVTWSDINKNNIVDQFELSDYSSMPGITDETLSGGILGAYADGVDNDGDGEIDEGIDEMEEGIRFSPINASFWDTDHDGLGDVDEIFGIDTGSEYDVSEPISGYGIISTDPTADDSDQDSLDDNLELTRLRQYKPYITNPWYQDSDSDGLTDASEWELDFYPMEDFITTDNYDANGDGAADKMDDGILVNGIKIQNDIDRTNPRLADTDGDDLPDGWEYKFGKTNIRKFLIWHDKIFGSEWAFLKHSDIPENIFPSPTPYYWVINPVGQYDKLLDPDGDGLNNWEEFKLGTDPLKIDSDNDGLPDNWEFLHRSYNSEFARFNLDPTSGDTIINDPLDDEDGDGNNEPCEELWDGKDNDGDGEVVKYLIINGIKTMLNVFNNIDDDNDGLVDESDEVSFKNWLDDDGDGLVDEGIDEEFDLNDANEDYDRDGVWYTIAFIDDDGDGLFDEDVMDDDFDGRINEDRLDGFDNDLDGLIDEDTGTLLDDNDHDGKIDEDPKRYYHPFTNLMEYNTGFDIDNDGENEITTWPNEADTDGDKLSDGWELWYTDTPTDINKPGRFEDNDLLPRGWEELFNGSLIIFPTDYMPRGLMDLNNTINYVGKFDPTKTDSDNDGLPDGLENYDDDWVQINFDEDNIGNISEKDPCNNLEEYWGHSDPTCADSKPIIEGTSNYRKFYRKK